jgi:D-beta-D-heptose 7-phosphate kinase/D-beta-D-heptose 1-phosphate adenosyltransferase
MRGPLVVVGDSLLDIDVVGTANRLCPDAPVPVLDDVEDHPRPGGAGLAALMAAADGHEVVLVTAVGDDEAGRRLERLLVGVRVVRVQYDGPTPVKERIRSGGQSLARLDRGTAIGRYGPLGAEARAALSAAAAVLVSDYGRGITSLPDLRRHLGSLPSGVPVVWDPHPRGAEPTPNAHLVTPNQSEAADWARRLGIRAEEGATPLGAAATSAAGLLTEWRSRAVAVTLGSRGALLTYGEGAPVVSPAPSGPCVDSCGAGDRFAVTATVELGEGRLPTEAVGTAVRAASAYVAAGGPLSLPATSVPSGAAPHQQPEPSTDDVLELVRRVKDRGGAVVAAGGCFDLLHPGHVATLEGARSLGDCLVVCLNSDASVRRLKGPGRPFVTASDRARVLSALQCVDGVVVFDDDTPAEVLDSVRPDIWVKGGDYAGVEVPEAAVLRRWGGQVVTVSYLAGHSTSRLAATAAGAADLPTPTALPRR